jgi:hypothetical protein
MRIETPRPSPREDGDYAVWVTMGYGDPDAIIHLAKNGTLDLRDVHADDCDRLIRAAARAKEEILRYQAMMAAPHGSRYLYQGTCQLCGKPADDPEALHGEPQRSALDCGCAIPGTVGPGVPVHCITHGNTAVALPVPAAQDDDEADDPFIGAAEDDDTDDGGCLAPSPAGSECMRAAGHDLINGTAHRDVNGRRWDDDGWLPASGMQDPAPVVRVISDGALPPLCDEFRRGDNGLCATCGRTRYVHERSGFIAADSPVLRGAKIGGGQ